MTSEERLSMLKLNLQMLTSANDTYLSFLLEQAEAAIAREGIQDDQSPDYNACVIDYAAYLYRKRAASTNGTNGFMPNGGETAMPRFLRYQLNNILFSQKLSNTEDES